MKKGSHIALLAAMALVAVACNRSSTQLTTTTSILSGSQPSTSIAGSTTTTSAPGTTTTVAGEAVTTYDIAVREPVAKGEVLYVVIPPGKYTEADLQAFVGDMVAANPKIWQMYVFDDQAAVAAARVPAADRTASEKDLLAKHHLVSLLEGQVVRFEGPYSSYGEVILGS